MVLPLVVRNDKVVQSSRCVLGRELTCSVRAITLAAWFGSVVLARSVLHTINTYPSFLGVFSPLKRLCREYLLGQWY